MREALRVWAVVTFMILATVLQMNVMADMDAGEYLKEDLNIAVHDAAVKGLDSERLADGKMIFDKKKAFKVFKESLERNAQLTSDSPSSRLLTPSNQSFFQDPFKVVTFKVIDDSNGTFPYMYHMYHHPLYDMDAAYEGPTIVAVVETQGPRFFSGKKQVIRKAASYTYKR